MIKLIKELFLSATITTTIISGAKTTLQPRVVRSVANQEIITLTKNELTRYSLHFIQPKNIIYLNTKNEYEFYKTTYFDMNYTNVATDGKRYYYEIAKADIARLEKYLGDQDNWTYADKERIGKAFNPATNQINVASLKTTINQYNDYVFNGNATFKGNFKVDNIESLYEDIKHHKLAKVKEWSGELYQIGVANKITLPFDITATDEDGHQLYDEVHIHFKIDNSNSYGVPPLIIKHPANNKEYFSNNWPNGTGNYFFALSFINGNQVYVSRNPAGTDNKIIKIEGLTN